METKQQVSGFHPWIGQQVRGISEHHWPVFERQGTICDVLDDAHVQWISDKRLLPWTSELADVEFWPPRCPKGWSKQGLMSQAELQEVHARIPELQKVLAIGESLQDLHIALGDFLIHRDVRRDVAEDVKVPTLHYPEVVLQRAKWRESCSSRAGRSDHRRPVEAPRTSGSSSECCRSLDAPCLQQVWRVGVQDA